MMEQDIYFKQKKLFNPHEQELKIHVYGAGSIGSHVIVGLAKIGVKDITVYDYDIVEESNIPAQFFRQNESDYHDDSSHIGEEKIKAISDMCYEMTGTEIEIVNIKIDEAFQPDLSLHSIHILAFDNIEARKIIFEKLQGYPVYLIDGRIGGFNYEKYFIDCKDKNLEYQKSLEGKFSELECGEKCLWPVNSLIASKIICDVIKLSRGDKPTYFMQSHALSNLTISREVQK